MSKRFVHMLWEPTTYAHGAWQEPVCGRKVAPGAVYTTDRKRVTCKACLAAIASDDSRVKIEDKRIAALNKEPKGLDPRLPLERIGAAISRMPYSDLITGRMAGLQMPREGEWTLTKLAMYLELLSDLLKQKVKEDTETIYKGHAAREALRVLGQALVDAAKP